MGRRSILLLLICVFIAGVFFGIWITWRVWKEKAKMQHLVYDLRDNHVANLEVHTGDTITLKSGGKATNPTIKVVGQYPLCTKGGRPDTCTIDPSSVKGPYHFACTSGNGIDCPDPGVQQSGSNGGLEGYFEFAGTNLADLFGMRSSFVETPDTAKPATARPAFSSVTVYVSCGNNTPELDDVNGYPLTDMTVTRGQTVFWESPIAFTLTTTNSWASVCSNGTPGSANVTQAECDTSTTLSPQNRFPYVVTVNASSTCSNPNPLPATLTTQ